MLLGEGESHPLSGVAIGKLALVRASNYILHSGKHPN